MDSKFFDIPFYTVSADSDFCCRDGEVEGFYTNSSNVAEDLSGDLKRLTPKVDFALVRTTLAGWHIHPDVYPSRQMVATNPSTEYWTGVLPQLLNVFQAEAAVQNLFVAPFYAMAVWKTVKNTYIAASEPVMLIPNSEIPTVTTDSALSERELDLKLAAAVCSLRIRFHLNEALRDFTDRIVSLEILVTHPTPNYSSFISYVPMKRVTTHSFSRCLDTETGEIADRRICTETLQFAWKAGNTTSTGIWNVGAAGYENKKFYPLLSIPLSEVDRLEDYTDINNLKSMFVKPEEEGGIPFESTDVLKQGNLKSQRLIIEGDGKEIDITTRPLKLSGAGRLERIRRVYLRGDYRPELLTMKILASRDMMKWWCVAKSRGNTVAAMPEASFRFFKVNVRGTLEEGRNLQGVSIF